MPRLTVPPNFISTSGIDTSVSGVIYGKSLNPANITFNNNGNLITLLTTAFENFIFADSSFSYSRLT